MKMNAAEHKISRNTLFYSPLLLFILILHTFTKGATVKELLFLLAPVASVIEKVFNTPFYFQENVGFIYEPLYIVINKSCSGATFWIICFSMLSFSFAGKREKLKNKYFLCMFFLLISYIIALFANTSRIIIAVQILQLEAVRNTPIERVLHQGIGVVVYLVYLWGIYITFTKLLKVGKENEEVT